MDARCFYISMKVIRIDLLTKHVFIFYLIFLLILIITILLAMWGVTRKSWENSFRSRIFFPHGAIAGKSLNCMTSCVLFPLTTHVPEDALFRNVLCLVKALTIMNKEKLSRDVTLIHFVHAKDVDVYRRQWMLLSQILWDSRKRQLRPNILWCYFCTSVSKEGNFLMWNTFER